MLSYDRVRFSELSDIAYTLVKSFVFALKNRILVLDGPRTRYSKARSEEK